MYGSDTGTLNIYIETMPKALNNVSSTLVWKKSGTQGNQWLRATETLYNLNSTTMYGWRVAFEGVVGKGFLGDIALDDIFLSRSACPPSRLCDFELGLCDFHANPTGSWIQQQADNLTNFINQDHTSSTSLGYFARAVQDNAKYKKTNNLLHLSFLFVTFLFKIDFKVVNMQILVMNVYNFGILSMVLIVQLEN